MRAGWFASSLPVRPMIFYLVTRVLWYVPLLLQVAIAAVMLRRKLVGRFPVFFGYTVLVASRATVLPNVGSPQESKLASYLKESLRRRKPHKH